MATINHPPYTEPANESWHGTYGGYTNHRCKGPKCKAAVNKYNRDRKHSRNGLPPGDPRHGKDGTYHNWRCKCVECKVAHNKVCGGRNKRRRQQEGKDGRQRTL